MTITLIDSKNFNLCYERTLCKFSYFIVFMPLSHLSNPHVWWRRSPLKEGLDNAALTFNNEGKRHFNVLEAKLSIDGLAKVEKLSL